MKITTYIKTSLSTIVLMVMVNSSQSQADQREFYQLKTYTLGNEKQENITDAYLRDAYLPALKRMKIRDVGVFKMHPSKYFPTNKIFVLIPFSSLDQLYTIEAKLATDKDYLKAGTEYLQAKHDEQPYDRISSTLMRAFVDMPILKPTIVEGPRNERIYELRSYESPSEAIYKNKVDMFNAGGEIVLFDELGFNAVFYAEVLSGDKMPNLMYMTTFKNQESRDEHWKAFGNAPKWKEISSMPKYQNNVSHIDRFFLYPTDYSDY